MVYSETFYSSPQLLTLDRVGYFLSRAFECLLRLVILYFNFFLGYQLSQAVNSRTFHPTSRSVVVWHMTYDLSHHLPHLQS